MKKLFTLLALATAATAVSAQERSAFSNVGVSLNAATTGLGATLSTPLGKHFNARAGFGVLPYTLKYTLDALNIDVADKLQQEGITDVRIDTKIEQEIDLKGRIEVPAAHFLVDYTPFKEGLGAFHLTAGLFFGGNNLIHVNGNANIDRLHQRLDEIKADIDTQYPEYPGIGDMLDLDVSDFNLEVADSGVRLNEDGTADAYVKVNSLRPYFGLGWGNAIPKRRVGFRFDIGALYQGKPSVYSPNYADDLNSEMQDDDIQKVMDYAKFWPQISFQLTFRLLKDRK